MVPLDVATRVLAEFEFPPESQVALFRERGNINLDAFVVTAPDDSRAALLQRINTEVFALPDRVLANMEAVLQVQARAALHPEWIIPTLIPARGGASGVREGKNVWRMMELITGVRSHKSLSVAPRPPSEVAREAARGLARYLDATADLPASAVRSSLPGYRDARLYLDQWHCALEGIRDATDFLPEDPEVRSSVRPHYAVRLDPAQWVLRRTEVRPAADIVSRNETLLTLLSDARTEGRITDRVIHGDTKLENFLFHESTGGVAALVDLDTIMPQTWLVDWGDMVRSLVNVAGEKTRDLNSVRVDETIYDACVEGFLGEIRSATPVELELMPLAPAAIALELGIRFLTDYLRG
ncbi:MAG: hypothetical protein C4320_06550, partial [Armatimonadota bacterium]